MKWIKKGHIFKPDGTFEWSKEYAQIPRVVVLHDRIRIFYATRCVDENNIPISQSSFIDVDKKDLSSILYIHNKPVLDLGKKGSFSEFGIHPTMLLPFKNSLYFFYQGWQRGNEFPYITEIGLAISNDHGSSFDKVGDTPILMKSEIDPYFVNGVFILKRNDLFYMWYSSGVNWIEDNGNLESVYKVKSAVSADLVNWDLKNDLCVPPIAENECQNSATVLYLKGRYHMWFCYRPALDFRNAGRGYRIGYASSVDMIEWTRDDSLAGIDIEKEESWDSQMICYPYVFELEGKIIMLYSGNYFGKTGFGYAELELN